MKGKCFLGPHPWASAEPSLVWREVGKQLCHPLLPGAQTLICRPHSNIKPIIHGPERPRVLLQGTIAICSSRLSGPIFHAASAPSPPRATVLCLCSRLMGHLGLWGSGKGADTEPGKQTCVGLGHSEARESKASCQCLPSSASRLHGAGDSAVSSPSDGEEHLAHVLAK